MANDTKLEQATLGGGCYWCLEAPYQMIEGVRTVVSGYAGGHTENPTDREVYSGTTGHAEVVQITFDPVVVTYADILDIFWVIHNPTTLNQQGADVGSHYRSIILYSNAAQRTVAEHSRDAVQSLWKDPIVTEIEPLSRFYPAPDYQQNFYRRHGNAPYCQIVINPKLRKLREKFASRIVVS